MLGRYVGQDISVAACTIMPSLFLVEPSSFAPLTTQLIPFTIVVLFPSGLIELFGTLQRHFSCEEWYVQTHP